jgi:Fumarylacetoacetate (FAA) hydrolase family
MFHPVDHPLKRGWVGRIEGEHVFQLAAQTLQAFFTGGGSAREHAVYPLTGVQLLTPVLQPPAIRVFDDQQYFCFANPAAILGPTATIGARAREPSYNLSQGRLALLLRLAVVVGAEAGIGGFTIAADWRRPALAPPKDRDFALALGPVVVTPDELDPEGLGAIVSVDGQERLLASFGGFDWEGARAHAADGTTLRAGDLLLGPPLELVDGLAPGSAVELDVTGIGVLSQRVAE